MIAPIEDKSCCCCHRRNCGGTHFATQGFHSEPMDCQLRRLCEDGNCDSNSVSEHNDLADDAEMNFITKKLRELQERRYQMLHRWSDDDDGRPVGHHGLVPEHLCTQDGFSSPATVARCVRRTSCETTVRESDPDSMERTNGVGNTSVDHDDCMAGRDNLGTGATAVRMNQALQRLRHELASLMSEDNAVFEQLLSVRHTIAQLKQQNDDLYYDPEVTYLSNNYGSLRLCCRNSLRKNHLDGYLCEHNSEDSGVSLESSGVSSPSMSPSPIGATPVVRPLPPSESPSESHDPSFHRNTVTFPPSRNRHSRYDVLPSGLGKSRRSSISVPGGVGDDRSDCLPSKLPVMTAFKSSGRFGSGNPPVLLVRSRSITLLPRGVLIRREESYDSGFVSYPAEEVFV